MHLVAEFTVEPFVPGEPGPHVQAALDAARSAGLEPDIGPFGTAIRGHADIVIEALSAIVTAATAAGATRVALQVEVID